ncbi:hypothetical protein Lser_V15G36047 [Lactuca serriola]
MGIKPHFIELHPQWWVYVLNSFFPIKLTIKSPLGMAYRDFGSFESLLTELKSAATTQFGSGWAWLVYKEEEKKLVVVNSPNAINPLVLDYHPLLTIDVWEHAYYLDFQNRRPDYVSVFLDKLVSWEAVSLRLEAAKILMIRKKKGVESN